jgi:tripartite-type tricarboxylate transporter receptor subunit TctC
MFNRRTLLASLAYTAAATFSPSTFAQTVIDKPLKIVVGFPPGGAADSVARLLAE